MWNSSGESIYNTKLEFFMVMLRECFLLSNVTHSTLVANQTYNENGTWCNVTFDGFSCWDPTPPGATAMRDCPDFIIGFDPRLTVYKTCSENGKWLEHPHYPNSNKSWTNYTSCVDFEDLAFRTTINTIYVFGYSISVASLLISLAIFFYFRSLRCTRIRIHMHLFSAITLNNVLWIIWYKGVISQADVVQGNSVWCQLLHVITNYFMVTSYFWMFIEGLHLHIALVVVFVKDDIAMRWFIFVGWAVSMFDVLLYAVVRYFFGDTERCWMDTSETFWIIISPVVISLLASFSYTVPLQGKDFPPFLPGFSVPYCSGPVWLMYMFIIVFLVNVIRVLLTKLHQGPNQCATTALKKAARASVLLVPLFGLHFVLIPLRPDRDSPFEKIYQVVAALLISLQGLCVSVFFCFTNHDVITAAQMQWERTMHKNDDLPMTGVSRMQANEVKSSEELKE